MIVSFDEALRAAEGETAPDVTDSGLTGMPARHRSLWDRNRRKAPRLGKSGAPQVI